MKKLIEAVHAGLATLRVIRYAHPWSADLPASEPSIGEHDLKQFPIGEPSLRDKLAAIPSQSAAKSMISESVASGLPAVAVDCLEALAGEIGNPQWAQVHIDQKFHAAGSGTSISSTLHAAY
jgi:hypothetical protein